MRPDPNFLRVWLHLLKKSLMEHLIFLCSASLELADNSRNF